MEDIVFYGADWCPDCRRAKAYLKSNNIDYKFVDVDINEAATDLVQTLNNCLLYTSPSPRDQRGSRMPSSA